MFIVKKSINGGEYYYLRKSVREKGKVRAVNVAYLGKSKKGAVARAKEIEGKLLKGERKGERMEINGDGRAEVGVIRGASIKDVGAKKFNIYVGISLGNKWFNRDNLKESLFWVLKHTKEKAGLLIGDTLHAINYEVRNKMSPENARRKALRKGDEMVTMLNEIIDELPAKDRRRVDIIRWDEVKNYAPHKKFASFLRREYVNNVEFREEVLKIVNAYLARDKKLSENDIVRLGAYIIDELPELLNGFEHKGVYYGAYCYPYDGLLNRMVENIQKKKIFPEFHDKVDIKNHVFIELDVKGGKENEMEKEDESGKTNRGETKGGKDFGKEEKDFVSFIQEAGMIWGPSPEIYGGVAGFYTYGPLGKLLKNKVEGSVRKLFNSEGFRELEGPSVLPDKVWKASGHLDTFKDRIIKCGKCGGVFRADKIIEENYDVAADAFSNEKLLSFIKEKGLKCPSCKSEFEYKIETQSLMMKTKVAGVESSLRPETATVTYLPFLRAYNYFRKKVPFGVYQIGKAFRNEISPRQHVLRGREFTQAEGQLFVDPLEKNNWEKFKDIEGVDLPFWDWKSQEKDPEGKEIKNIEVGEALKKGFVKSQAYVWCVWLAYMQFRNFGIPAERIRLRQHWPDEKAFYADDAWDIEVKLNNYGWTEVCGVHDRTDYDLKQHSKESGVSLEAMRENGERFVPHVLEIAFGTDRPTYALLDLFYDKKEEGEGKSMFKVPYGMAPIDVSVFPLMKKPELLKMSERVRDGLGKEFVVDYDVSGSIGKRYLRSAVAGTPFAVTVDYDSLEGKDVTVRDRDSEKQVRIKIESLRDVLGKLLGGEMKFEDLE